MVEKYTKYFAMLPSDVMAIDHKQLNSTAKLVYSIIFTMLNSRDSFYMSNKIIGERIGNYRPIQISRCVSTLNDLGLIKINMITDENGGFTGRLVELDNNPLYKKIRGSYQEKQGGLIQKDKGALSNSINKYISKNRLVNKLDKDTLSSSKTEHDHSAAKEVIAYLNEKTGKHYRNTASNYRMIEPRLKDYSVDDLKHVVDVKCSQWINDSKMNKFLRPATLFQASKIDGYLNEDVKNGNKSQYTGQIINEKDMDTDDLPF